MNENDLRARLVPAVCTQCGATLEVDPNQEAAVCKYCGTPFVVEKAVQNYQVQNARIEHVDKVNIDMKGTADSFFDFVGKQMSESREARREERRMNRAAEHEMQKGFLKIFGYMCIGMFVLAIVMFLVMNLRGGTEEPSPEPAETTAAVQALPAEEDAQTVHFGASGEIRLDYNP